jgi:hypothetical protein
MQTQQIEHGTKNTWPLLARMACVVGMFSMLLFTAPAFARDAITQSCDQNYITDFADFAASQYLSDDALRGSRGTGLSGMDAAQGQLHLGVILWDERRTVRPPGNNHAASPLPTAMNVKVNTR